MASISTADSPSIETAHASIYRNENMQTVGYVVRHGSNSGEVISGTAGQVQDEQLRAKAILAPLVQWQSGLKGSLVKNPSATSFACSP
jgi:hypothetical protein